MAKNECADKIAEYQAASKGKILLIPTSLALAQVATSSKILLGWLGKRQDRVQMKLPSLFQPDALPRP
eukprot:876182-Pelagomonas_calceolata.AAC.1